MFLKKKNYSLVLYNWTSLNVYPCHPYPGQKHGKESDLFCMFLYWVLCGGNPWEHMENMLHTKSQGAPSRNQTQDLLARRQQCKAIQAVPHTRLCHTVCASKGIYCCLIITLITPNPQMGLSSDFTDPHWGGLPKVTVTGNKGAW